MKGRGEKNQGLTTYLILKWRLMKTWMGLFDKVVGKQPDCLILEIFLTTVCYDPTFEITYYDQKEIGKKQKKKPPQDKT